VSASVTDRARAAGRARTAAVPGPREATQGTGRGTATGRTATTRNRTGADRAYARRDERLRRLVDGVRPQRGAAPTGRAKFVLLVMVLLVGGLVATLWLSTAASADSYRLQDARAGLTTLTQQDESLHREVAQMASAPELARRAEQLGMVRVEDPARLVVGPDGTVTVVGKPQAAPAPAPPPAPTAPAAGAQAGAAPPAVPDGTTQPAPTDATQPAPADGDQDGTAPRDPAQQAVPPTAPAAAPDQAVPDQTGPDQTAPDQTAPDQAPGGTPPGPAAGTAGPAAGGGTD
jgi:hypothetical protein